MVPGFVVVVRDRSSERNATPTARSVLIPEVLREPASKLSRVCVNHGERSGRDLLCRIRA
jgi:hypothetical protein